MVNVSSHLIGSKRMISAGILLVRSKSITSIDASLQPSFFSSAIAEQRVSTINHLSEKAWPVRHPLPSSLWSKLPEA